MAHTNDRAGLTKFLTLAIDIDGSHLKAAVLKASGKMSTDPVRGLFGNVTEPTPWLRQSRALNLSAYIAITLPGVMRTRNARFAPVS
jgi:hypothetical protein